MSHRTGLTRSISMEDSDLAPLTPTTIPSQSESPSLRGHVNLAEGTNSQRRRPPAISTNSDSFPIYGPAPRPAASDDRTPTQDHARPAVRTMESFSNREILSPESISASKLRKPGMPRRASSKYPAPHKGDRFSADDDPSDFDSDTGTNKASLATRISGPSLRRQPSTLRRRPSTLRRRQPHPSKGLPVVNSQGEEEEEMETKRPTSLKAKVEESPVTSGEEGTVRADEDADDGDEDDDADTSDAESFTLRDRQAAINETHPFGIRIWKPALYKKSRSVEKTAEGDIHSTPGGNVNKWLWVFNLLWTVLFGWWLALAALLGALTCIVLGFTPGTFEYGRVLWGLARYLFYPFGKFVKLEQDEAYAEEDEGEGRSITEYEQWQSGDLEDGRLFFGPLTSRSLIGRRRESMDSTNENDSLLGRTWRSSRIDQGPKAKRRLFGRGQWTIGRVIFFVFFYFLITPLLFFVSGICWFLVFSIPMGKVILLLFYHLRRHPLALSFHDDGAYSRGSAPSSSILLCTYRAVGLKYWKYTIDGTNIFLINLIGVVLFAIFDYWVLGIALGLRVWLVHPGFVFALSLFSIIPLAYFIGQAVASISAQSSMGLGAAINAFFSTIVEVFLYCVALKQGKSQLVEGSIIGSIFAGILFLPGLSMCFGAIKRKTQRFNVKSAGVTSTMLLFATIAAFGPTLFYKIYGSHELNCHACITTTSETALDSDCRRCYFTQAPAVTDRFFLEAVRPYCWFAAVLLFLSYVIGLWFTLRTHAAVIWATETDEKKPLPNAGTNGSVSHLPLGSGNSVSRHQRRGSGASLGLNNIKDTQLYNRILGQSLKQVGLERQKNSSSRHASASSRAPLRQSSIPPHLVPPKSSGGDTFVPDNDSQRSVQPLGLSEEDNTNLIRQVAEMAATAATVAARDATRDPRKTSAHANTIAHHGHRSATVSSVQRREENEEVAAAEAAASGGGHDAPNWSRMKSAVILLGATLLYAIIAEILVDTVDVVLESVDIDEKFLGITLFALVPNTTEFLNAISFAMNGNIALSMEIGSAYALQVCLLQIPALVLFSAINGRFLDPQDLLDHTFNLIFPQWDMVTVILCVFLLSYMYGEGKSNYFKGSILLLTYLVVILGFYMAGYSQDMDMRGVDRSNTLAIGQQTFRTIGRTSSGLAF